MTFDQTLEKAVSAAPGIAARRSQAEAARSAAIAAPQLPDPRLELGIQDFPVSGPNAGSFTGDDFTMVRVGISQDIPSRARRRARLGRARSDVEAAVVGVEAEERSVRIAAGLAWVDLYFAQRRLATLAELDQNIDDLASSLRASLTSGSERPSSALQPAQLKAVVADRRAALVGRMARARALLTRWTGDPAPDVSGRPPQALPDRAELIAGIEGLPSIRLFDAATRQSEAEVRLAEAAKRPDWSVSASYGRRDPRFGDLVSIGVSVDLPFFARNRQNPIIAARTHELERARLDREAALRETIAQLDSDLAEHEMRREQFERARDTLFPLAAQRAQLDLASYAAGRIDLGTALLTTRGLAEAELDLIDREAEAAREAVRILLTYGSR